MTQHDTHPTHASVLSNSSYSDFALNNHQKQKRYQQPAGLVARIIWRAWIWTQTTFAFSFMEPWEIILIFSIVGITLLLFTIGLIRYVPNFLVTASLRAQYYFFGTSVGVDGKLGLGSNTSARILDIDL